MNHLSEGTWTYTNRAAFDADAMTIAVAKMPLTGLATDLLIHAARYEGEGFRPQRRTEIVAYLRPLLLGA